MIIVQSYLMRLLDFFNVYYIKGLLLLSFCFFCIISIAQNNIPRIKYYSLEDGMSQVSANDLLLDKNGFVWIATADGLNKFDGNIFKHYKRDLTDTTSISGNYITRLATDTNGIIWIGTNGRGLNRYNQSTDTFVRIKLDSLAGNEMITDIIPDDNGGIWFTANNNKLHHLVYENEKYINSSYSLSGKLTSLLKDKKGWLWAGTRSGKIYGFKNSYDQYEIEIHVDGNVQAFYRQGNQLLIGSYGGFYIYNIITKETNSIELEKSGSYNTNYVVDLLKEDESKVWIGTGKGVYLYDFKKLEVIQKIENAQDLEIGLSNSTVQSLLKISPGVLLVGTANGLNVLEFKDQVFKNISKNKRGAHLLNDNVIFSIYKDKDLWIGTSDGGLNLISNNKNYYFLDNTNNPKAISGSVVRAIVHDKINERMWFGTTRGLSMIDLKSFNPEQPIFKNFYHNPNNTNSINSNFIKDLILDKNNNLWGATHEHGIFRLEYNNQMNTIYRYAHQTQNEKTLVSDLVNCLANDSENNIWIGTQNGLSKLSFEDESYLRGNFKNYKHEFNNSLSSNTINDITIDAKNQIWLATRNGLNKLNDSDTFDSWTKQKQFPNTLLYSIQDDNEGHLWLGTNNGIVKFDTTLNSFSHYGILDNIQGKEFDLHAKFKDNEGRIYLGGIDGVTSFLPKDLNAIDQPRALYFSQLRLKDSIIKPSANKKGLLKEPIESVRNLEFNHNQFPFYLTYSTLDYRLDKNVQFAYKLSPLDNDWNFLNDSEIQFLNLPSGEYNLLVNGFSRGNMWATKPLEMTLSVKPAWWLSHVALLSYFILLILTVFGVYRFQLSKKLALSETKRLKEIDHLKNSLYTNITHEFRTPLTVILGMVETLKNNIIPVANAQNKTDKPLSVIDRNSKNLLKMVNSMLDLTKLESAHMQLNMVQSDIVSFIKYIFESFESLAKEKEINYTFYSEVDELIMDYDSDKVSTIITNLLVNAIKFSPKKEKVIIHLNKVSVDGNQCIQVKVVDTGIGLSKDEMSNVFNKFYQADSSSSRRFGGTGIGLALTKQLVVLMKGSITVKSKLNKGSEFILRLPISNNATLSETSLRDNVPISKEMPVVDSEQKDYKAFLDNEAPIALVIEDNDDVAYYLKTCLQEKYKVLHAPNGEIGVKMAFKYIPDVVICDVMMPKKNGFEVCSELKTDIITNHIPVIMLTAKASDSDRLEGLSHGADAYLTKPFNKKELFTRIEHLVDLRKRMIAKFSQEDYKTFLDKREENPETIFLNKVSSIIQKEMHNSEFGTSQLAAELSLSESQIYRKLKAITDRSTAVFIRSIRLHEARRRIQTTEKTVSEIAYEVGFNDPSWFSRAFKEEFGKSPSDL